MPRGFFHSKTYSGSLYSKFAKKERLLPLFVDSRNVKRTTVFIHNYITSSDGNWVRGTAWGVEAWPHTPEPFTILTAISVRCSLAHKISRGQVKFPKYSYVRQRNRIRNCRPHGACRCLVITPNSIVPLGHMPNLLYVVELARVMTFLLKKRVILSNL